MVPTSFASSLTYEYIAPTPVKLFLSPLSLSGTERERERERKKKRSNKISLIQSNRIFFFVPDDVAFSTSSPALVRRLKSHNIRVLVHIHIQSSYVRTLLDYV